MQNSFDYLKSLNFKFLPSTLGKNKKEKDKLWEAHEECEKRGMSPLWIHHWSELKQLKLEGTDVVVVDKFLGEAFEELLETNCLIIGPNALLRCFRANVKLPSGPAAIYNLAMSNNIVELYGFTPRMKLFLQQRIHFMGGSDTNLSTRPRTHLITANRTTSEQYSAAVKEKIPIYHSDWVKAVWERNLEEYRHANDETFEGYRKTRSLGDEVPSEAGSDISVASTSIEDLSSTSCSSRRAPKRHGKVLSLWQQFRSLRQRDLQPGTLIWDQCTVYVSCFTEDMKERIWNFLRNGSAHIRKRVGAKVTHVVIDPNANEDELKSEILDIQKNGSDPWILQLSWLIECIKKGEKVAEEAHEYDLDLDSE